MELRLAGGGVVRGAVIDDTADGVVLALGDRAHVFAWSEVEAGSAFRATRDLIASRRGGLEGLTAEDHLALGRFALARGNTPAAMQSFRKAKERDARVAVVVEAILQARREQQRDEAEWVEEPPGGPAARPAIKGSAEPPAPRDSGLGEWTAQLPVPSGAEFDGTAPDDALRSAVREVYLRFGQQVTEQMDGEVAFIETEHFLIWTDWSPAGRRRLADACEEMYRAQCAWFGVDPAEDVFLAKCPLFAWRSKRSFQRFARTFDGFTGENAIGYTRSIERNGHVHLVLYLGGPSREEFERFRYTLVHEGTHAFLHRFHATRLIPHWINEGMAEAMAERVLGDSCPAAEKADLIAHQYVRFDWSILPLLRSADPIGVDQYPLAASVVLYLLSRGSDRCTGLIADLKDGAAFHEALGKRYEGMTVTALEAEWRDWVRRRTPLARRGSIPFRSPSEPIR